MGSKGQESDSSIVLGDGRTDHEGKGRAEWLTEQSTHAAGRNVPRRSVSSTLLELNEKAKREPKYRFRSLYKEIDLQMLYESFRMLKRAAAPGVDGVTMGLYEEDLDANLRGLLGRLKDKTYRALHVRRRLIPKGNGKMRPLGIPALEDKIVQQSAKRLLEAIYEADFQDESHGYRPNRGPRDASQQLQNTLFFGRTHWIVEADIKGFFDNVDHDWLERMLELRVDDRAFIALIRKWLKAGVLEEGGKVIHPATGTPQGGIISPVLANIYLHHVLDLWIERVVKKQVRGQVVLMRYADDFVVGFEYGDQAQRFFARLPDRLAKFGLSLAVEKSGIVRFSRCDIANSGRFGFLGFDYYWAHTRSGKKTVKRRTAKEKFRASLKSLKQWLGKHRGWRLSALVEALRRKYQGCFNYYGVIGNSRMLSRYWLASQRLVFRALNRRSQRKSYSWTAFTQMWKTLAIPGPRVVETYRNQHPQYEFPQK